jgi:hypothetical protein
LNRKASQVQIQKSSGAPLQKEHDCPTVDRIDSGRIDLSPDRIAGGGAATVEKAAARGNDSPVLLDLEL